MTHSILGSEHGKVVYREDIFVGYRHYQARKIKPLFAFGYAKNVRCAYSILTVKRHGLSYTLFELSDLTISLANEDGPEIAIHVSCKVKNVGQVKGSEIVQVYVSYPANGTTNPPLQLKGFAKARDLEPGASSIVNVALDKFAISCWDDFSNEWNVAGAQ